ncbi:MAG: hypothetical protein AB9856_04895 [Cellulosilyticaceae bacterium]
MKKLFALLMVGTVALTAFVGCGSKETPATTPAVTETPATTPAVTETPATTPTATETPAA